MRKNPYPGKWILFEGIDGSGKTTQARMLAERLGQEGHRTLLTREPTSDNIFGNLARFIYMCESLHREAPSELRRCMESAEYRAVRAIYDELQIKHISRFEAIAREVMMGEYKNLPTFLQLAMIFDRYHHHINTVIPALQEGRWVIADRDFLSTLAYSAGDNISWQPLLRAHEDILGDAFIMPDVLFILDIPVEVGIARTAAKQQGKKDYFDTEDMLTRIRDRYIELSGMPEIIKNTTCVRIAPENRTPEDVHKLLWPHVESILLHGNTQRNSVTFPEK